VRIIIAKSSSFVNSYFGALLLIYDNFRVAILALCTARKSLILEQINIWAGLSGNGILLTEL
jgi:hypothetical protein